MLVLARRDLTIDMRFSCKRFSNNIKYHRLDRLGTDHNPHVFSWNLTSTTQERGMSN